MMYKTVICAFVVVVGFVHVYGGPTLKDTKVAPVIHLTNRTKSPDITFSADAVKSLQEAYTIYADEASIAEAYLELFTKLHPDDWSVVIGYTTIVTKSTVYIECEVSSDSNKKLKSDSKAQLVAIFN